MALLAMSCFFLPAAAQTAPSYQVKAAFLYNFSQFVEWPSNAFYNAQAPFVIGILGADPFGSYLTELVKGEKAGNRPIVIKRFGTAAEAKGAHIVFINLPDAAAAIKSFAGQNTLTVGDGENFVKAGGMIRFFTEKNKIRFQINVTAARAANLVISAKLLRVAEIFNE